MGLYLLWLYFSAHPGSVLMVLILLSIQCFRRLYECAFVNAKVTFFFILIQGYILCKILWSEGGGLNGDKGEKRKRKTKENYIKTEKKALKMPLFGL